MVDFLSASSPAEVLAKTGRSDYLQSHPLSLLEYFLKFYFVDIYTYGVQ
jgi:hypothetical protein